MSSSVVVGLGNRFRRDDGAGPAVLDALAGRVPAAVRLVESDGEPSSLIDAWSGAELAVVVDAVSTSAAPGSLYRLDDPAELAAPSAASSHAVPLSVALDLATALGRRPRQLVVYGVVGADFGYGTGLSAPVADAVDQLTGLLAKWLVRPGDSDAPPVGAGRDIRPDGWGSFSGRRRS